MKRILLLSLLIAASATLANTQVPVAVGIQILKAEDARRYDDVLRNLMRSPNAEVRERAALAVARIGDDAAIADLVPLLSDSSGRVETMAAFAIGEVESIKGADAILAVLKDPKTPNPVRARAVEAAGKIAAANSKDEKSKALGAAIIGVLNAEDNSPNTPDTLVDRLALTAALRARPVGADEIVRKFLAFHDPDVICDALNTLARLRAKNANRDARDLLAASLHGLVRAGAARLLGVAEDKEAFDALVKAAVTDQDSRVRVSAIRSLAQLKDARAADNLLERGESLLAAYKTTSARPAEQSELLEIATSLGRLLAKSENVRAINFLTSFDKATGYMLPEGKIALAQISPKGFFESNDAFNRDYKVTKFPFDWHLTSSWSQGFAELAKLPADAANQTNRERAVANLAILQSAYDRVNNLTWADAKKPEIKSFIKDQKGLIFNIDRTKNKDVYLPAPELLRASAAFKTEYVADSLLDHLNMTDVQIRATAAELLADQPKSKENVDALKKAFDYALLHDKHDNDAQLAIMAALYKLDKKESVGTLLLALNATDNLVRKKAFQLLEDKELQKDSPGIPTSLESARAKHKDQVLPYSPAFGTKLGQVLNTDIDYRRALLRTDGSVKAVLTTEKGTFTIVFTPEEAPLTVDNWVKLARAGYFNVLEVHRVVPNFVMQDGDPRGDGNGGPGWSIRCEINMLPFDRGAVGMALSGKDTGGSQWFVDHSPQPHLDGGYTVFGHVNETDMKVVDNIVRGDKIISVRIVETTTAPVRKH